MADACVDLMNQRRSDMPQAGVAKKAVGAGTVAVWIALTVALAGCRSNEEAPAPPPAAITAPKAGTAWQLAPAPNTVRSGPWLGGPEPASGKLRSGITTFYTLDPMPLRADQLVEVVLRFEDVVADDATVELTVGDGAKLSASTNNAWRLPKGTASQVSLRITVPAGDSYLHVMTRQNQKSSVKSILLTAPGVNPASPSSPGTTVDARGEPLVRMKAEPVK